MRIETHIKLSEAIRLGAMLHPQGFERLFDHSLSDGRVMSSCAIGAALEAIGHSETSEYMELSKFPTAWSMLPVSECPACLNNSHAGTILSTIAHINDTHRWTREDIGRWVATVESLTPALSALTPKHQAMIERETMALASLGTA